ncbi:MAG: hydantoinase/oxoprolinase family protein [Dehalococcoidia bacterium]
MTLMAGVDVGGTFTDVTLTDTTRGLSWSVKTPSTPGDQSIGFLNGLEKCAALAGLPLSAIERCFHGTTVATNAILQRSETRLGLITTAGFKYVLEIGRHDIPREANYFGWVKPLRPVSPDRTREVSERVNAAGQIVVALNEDGARQAIRGLRDLDVESIAVSLLYSFLNPAHERRLAELIAEEHPAAFVSLSSEVLPRFREFERTMTTALNAYVAPHVSRYLGALERRLRERGCSAVLLIMKSNGGVVSAETASRQAIHTAVSGPAAGVIGAAALAASAGFPDVISIDVGGTSADVCLVRGGSPEITSEGRIGGFPMEAPMLDIHTIGAGGGSIASLTSTGGIAVGPRSAGADPGPACYGTGGAEPTVTDANLVLGRLPPHLLGGELPLSIAAAREAIERAIAGPLGLTVEQAGQGILEIIDNRMVGAIRTVSVARGLDARAYALVAFGGAGPLHAAALAQQLGIETVIVPARPGVLSTEGLLLTDLRNDYVRTCPRSGTESDITALNEVLASLIDEAQAGLDREGIPLERRQLQAGADLRYQHQGYELTAPLDEQELTAALLLQIEEAFHEEHRRLYTYDLRSQRVELVNLRVTATGLLPHAEPNWDNLTTNAPPASATGSRRILFSEPAGWLEAPVFDRRGLLPGQALTGPLAVDQDDSTTILFPGQSATVDRQRNLIIKLDRAATP